MNPKNRFQHNIAILSQKLPGLTEAQRAWIWKHCIKHRGYRTKNGRISCLKCGHTWQSKNGYLLDTFCEIKCPQCGAHFPADFSRRRVFHDTVYFCIVTTCKGYQAVRFFYLSIQQKVGEKTKIDPLEVVQYWIAPDNRYTVLARLRPPFCFSDVWSRTSNLEIRFNKRLYNIDPDFIYPRQRTIPIIQRNGFKGSYHKMTPFEMFWAILTESKAETLLKAKQFDLLYRWVRFGCNITDYWPSVRICIRNGYIIKDASVWCDYIDLLKYFGLDCLNPKYVCPDELDTAHDKLMNKKEKRQRQERYMLMRNDIKEKEPEYRETKGRYFGLKFTDGEIEIHVLESVQDIWEEGETMHHCVFSNEYYSRPDSLILSARIANKRIETVELSLNTLKVVQSRGACNSITPYHNRIIRLIEQNINEIKRRQAA